MSTRVILADDHGLFRAGLEALLADQPDMQVVGQVADGRSAVKVILDDEVDVIVMDATMPGMNGIEATRRIKAQRPGTHVLGLSMHSDRRFVLSMLEAGASGYLLKECVADELITAIRHLAEGRTYLSPAVADLVVEAVRSAGSPSAGDHVQALTDREREVLQLIAEGHSTRAIAKRLNVSAKTVSTHREHVMRKLSIENVAGLTKYAIKEGLTSAEA